MTQMRLGNLLNYGYTAIANYESGRNNPCIEDLKNLQQYLMFLWIIYYVSTIFVILI